MKRSGRENPDSEVYGNPDLYRRRLVQAVAGAGATGVAGCGGSSETENRQPTVTNTPGDSGDLQFETVPFGDAKVGTEGTFLAVERLESNPLDSDWSGTPSLSLPQSEADVRMDDWDGESDCSATARVGYDDDHFYFQATVTDDTHSPVGSSAWRGDSLQLAFASTGKFGPQYTFARVEGRDVVQLSQPNRARAGVADIRLETARDGSTTRYAAAMPWQAIHGSDAPPEGSFPFAFIVNDNDGSGRKGWVQWTDSIGSNKKASKLGTLGVEPAEAGWGAWMDSPLETLSDEEFSATISVANYEEEPVDLAIDVPAIDVTGASVRLQGQTLARIPVTITPTTGGKQTLESTLRAGDANRTVSTTFNVLDIPALKRRLDDLRPRVEELESLLEEAEAAGLPTDYPRIDVTTIGRFIQYGHDDIENDRVDRAIYVADQLDRMARETKETLEAAIAGDTELPAAPRYRTGSVEIEDQGFIAPRTDPESGGVERDNVLFSGYGHFQQLMRDIDVLQDFGGNIVSTGLGPKNSVRPPNTIPSWDEDASGDADATFTTVDDVAHSGQQSVHVRNETPQGSDTYGTLDQRADLEPETTYEISCWMKGENAKGVSFNLGWDNREYVDGGTFDWTEVSMTYTTGAEPETVAIRFVIADVTEDLWIDDVSVTAEGSEENLLDNPGFEQGSAGDTDADFVVRTDETTKVHDIEEDLRRAEEHDVAMDILLAPQRMPEWAFEKWPDLAVDQYGFINWNINHPKGREIMEAHLRAVTPILAQYDSLFSFCLSNEPHYNANDETYTKPLWEEFLERTHGSIDRLNQRYGSDYDDFASVPMLSTEAMGGEEDLQHQFDWDTFQNERMAEFHEWMAEIIEEHAPEVPKHTKMMANYFDGQHHGWWRGLDPELYPEFCEINGNDNFFKENEPPSGGFDHNQFIDYQTTLKEAPVFNSENHLINDGSQIYEPWVGDHVAMMGWQGAIHGQSAASMWVWKRAYEGSGSSAIDGILHRPVCVAANGKGTLDMNRLATEITAFQNAEADIALLFTPTSNVYQNDHKRAVSQAYRAASRMGIEVDIVSESIVQEEGLADYEVVVVPRATHVDAGTVEGVRDFATGDGTLVMDEGALARSRYDEQHEGLGRSAILDAATVLPADRGKKRLQTAVREAIESAGLRDVVLRDVETGEEPSGIEWRSVVHDGQRLVNVANYTQDDDLTLAVELDGDVGGQAQELIDRETVDPSEFALPGKQVKLLRLTS